MSDEFIEVERGLADATRPRRSHPKGWEPGVDTERGVLIVEGDETAPTDWSGIIRSLGLDPDCWTVDESAPVQVRAWDAPDGRRLFYYKASVEPLRSRESVDLDSLVSLVRRRRKSPEKRSGSVSRTLVVCLADWQAGKGSESSKSGTEQLVERVVQLCDELPRHLKALRRAGIEISEIAVVGMGDLVEACDGHYAQQTFQTELDNREQMRVVRRLIVELLTRWAGLVPSLVVGCVPGNHGQRRRNGKSYTKWGDNADVEVFEVVREVLAANPDAYSHIRWAIPDQEQTITLDLSGTIVGFAHGHQFGSGAGPQRKALGWWQRMAMNRNAIGDADVLVSGHFHHLQVHAEGVADSAKGRSWFQCPALDCGSPWWEHQGGSPTQQGTLTFVTGEDGWDHLRVL